MNESWACQMPVLTPGCSFDECYVDKLKHVGFPLDERFAMEWVS